MPQQSSDMTIKATAHITPKKALINDEVFVEAPGIVRATYEKLEMGYPKFFKMDRMCKLGVLGVDMLLRSVDATRFADDEIGLLFSNSDSSLESDVKHQQSIDEGAASPAIFVYTLPNIVLGEIGIRQKWYGEQLFTVTPEPDAEFLVQVVQSWFQMNKAKACVVGWINSLSDDFEAAFIWIENQENGGGIPLTALNLKQIISTHGRLEREA